MDMYPKLHACTMVATILAGQQRRAGLTPSCASLSSKYQDEVEHFSPCHV